jgi:CBS domain-containing protein
MLLKDLCTPDVVYCTPRTTILDAARLMRQRHVGDVIIVEDEESEQTPLGLITDRDIVVEVLAQERDPATVMVRDIMRTPVIIAHASEDAADALERMKRHGVRRIPVMSEKRRLAGIVTLDDLVRQLAVDAAALAEVIVREQDREHHTRR